MDYLKKGYKGLLGLCPLYPELSFRYVLNCYQVGKSRLRGQVIEKLEKEGYFCSLADLFINRSDDIYRGYNTLVQELLIDWI